jgi:hypothetical protein
MCVLLSRPALAYFAVLAKNFWTYTGDGGHRGAWYFTGNNLSLNKTTGVSLEDAHAHNLINKIV